MIAEKIPALAALSSDDKILLAAELWHDAVGSEIEAPSATLVEAIRERLDDYHAHPEAGSTWEEVRKRMVAPRKG